MDTRDHGSAGISLLSLLSERGRLARLVERGRLVRDRNRARFYFAVGLALSLLVTFTPLHHASASETTAMPTPTDLVQSTATNGDVTLSVFATPNESAEQVMVVIHGGPGFSHQYTRGLAALADDGLRLVTYDQRGMGGSTTPPDGDYSLAAYVADLEAVRAGLGAERVMVLGHSWGGLVAMAYATQFPNRINQLVLVSSVPPTWAGWNESHQRFSARLAQRMESGHVPMLIPPPVGVDCGDQIRALAPVYFADPDATWTTDWAEGTACDIALRRLTWIAVGQYDLSQPLSTLTGPVTVIFGDGDPFGVEVAQETFDALTSAQRELVILPSCGHFPWVECPESFLESLRPYLTP